METHVKYKRVYRTKGFKPNQRRFSVYRLRVRFLCLINKFLSRLNWRKSSSSCGQALSSIKNILISRSRRRSPAREENVECRIRSYGRSNSEAIAECLEFIKRTSVSSDDHE